MDFTKIHHNPLQPSTPGAPPWDPLATASGVYVTSDYSVAQQYADVAAEDTESSPVVLELDAAGLKLFPDPQAIDLLAEPYKYYRYDIFNYLKEVYQTKLFELVRELGGDKEARYQARRVLGPVFLFMTSYVTDPENKFPWVRAEFPSFPTSSEIRHQDKVFAAKMIFPHSWQLIPAIHKFYAEKAPLVILEWLGLESDEEESPFSLNSIYLRSNDTLPFSDEFWFFISKFAYIDSAIDWDRVSRLSVGDRLVEIKHKPASCVYHGTSLSRVRRAFPWAF